MPIDTEIYRKGIKGELTKDEIESLPKNYELYKQFFIHALEIRHYKPNQEIK